MPIANARVDVGSQELDVEHEPPIAESSQSIEKARFRKGMTTGQDGQMLYKMRGQRDTSLDRLARMPAKLQNSRQQTAKQGEVSMNARQVMLWHRRFAIRAQRELRRLVPRDVNAKFQNGMLEVTIPVPQQKEQRRSIPIEGDTKSQADSQKQAA